MAGTTRSTSHPQHGYPTDCAKAADRLGRPRAEDFPLLSVGQSRGEERRGEEDWSDAGKSRYWQDVSLAVLTGHYYRKILSNYLQLSQSFIDKKTQHCIVCVVVLLVGVEGSR